MVLLFQQSLAGASDFIDNMPKLAQDADRPGAMIWQKPGLNRAAYTRVMIEPITIFISPDSEYQGLNADDLKALSDGFNGAVTRMLEPEIPVVNQGGPGVLYMRAALVNVKLAKKKRRLFSYTPIGLVASTVKGNAAKVSLKGAMLEIEMLDAVSGERLGVLVDKAPKEYGEDLTWNAINNTFVFYAERFKSRMQTEK